MSFPGREPEPTPQGKPLSLHPLSFEEAVADLMKVEPEPKKPKKPAGKRASAKSKRGSR